jgi:two-component system nitrogen regulation sensor histidine kinase NtrY
LKIETLKNIKSLSKKSEELVKMLLGSAHWGASLITLEIGGDERQLSVYAIELTLGNENFKLISLQNIHTELEEKEMEAWQKLVRVLTHEIMNSVTPISSLANTVEGEIVDYLDTVKENRYCQQRRFGRYSPWLCRPSSGAVMG